MAARKAAKSSARKTTGKTVKKPANGNQKVVSLSKKRKNKHMSEIIAICAIALGILFAVSIYAGGGGVIGAAINGIFKGLFGIGAVILPVITITVGIICILKPQLLESRRIYLFIGVFASIISFAHILTNKNTVVYETLPAYAGAAFKNGATTNGGLFGALIGDALFKTLGAVGSYVLLIALALVFIILITDKSVLTVIFNGFANIKQYFSREYDDEEYEDEEEEEIEEEKKEEKPQPVRRNPKKAMVTIEKRPEEKDEENKVLLFNENATKKRSVLHDVEKKSITNVITLNGISEEIPHPTFTTPVPERGAEHNENEIKMKGIGLEEVPFDEYGYNKESDMEYVEPDDFPEEFFVPTSPMEPIAPKPTTPMTSTPTTTRASVPPYMPAMPASAPAAAATPMSALRDVAHIPYEFPPIDLLNKNTANAGAGGKAQILENSRKLEETLRSFGVEAKVIEVSKGPTVTRYELSPGQGVKVSKIAGLADDLALNLAAAGIRIEAPIPGKAAVGIEVPNKEVTPVFLREVLDDDAFKNFPSKLAFGLGKDIAGNTIVADIAKMPHLLIAGATGSGKSVCINTLITSLIYKADPNEVKLVMVDPKVVELSVYNGIPHLLIPVVTDPKKAAGALNWAVQEMITRYNLFAETSVRDLKGYNAMLKERGEEKTLPQIVIIIDELADLMMAAPGEVEDAICRLAQMARAAGLHLIIATQRPSVDVITGLIKANIPSRLAFSVSSGTDSRTILDSVGAEKLLGKGDMLFYPVGMSKPQRIQGAFISDKEVEKIVSFVKQNSAEIYDQAMIDKITASKNMAETSGEVDELFIYAAEFVIEKDKASASMLQRQFRVGYNRASRLIEELENHGIVGPEDGSKPRKVLMSPMAWEEYKDML